MKIAYRVFDPTGNITVLVETPVPVESQAEVAAKLMTLEPAAEQVGFLTSGGAADIALRMAGGEFCGNATMCAAVCAAEATKTDAGAFAVRISGADAPVQAAVQRQPDGSMRCTVDMPRPEAIDTRMLPGVGNVRVVRFPGISHIVLEEPMPRPLAERNARLWCGELDADALGLLFLDRRTARLTPLVYVPAAGTLFWESSCASGTAAVGAYLAQDESTVTASLLQPGGSLTIEVNEAGALRLTGTVRAGARREIEI